MSPVFNTMLPEGWKITSTVLTFDLVPCKSDFSWLTFIWLTSLMLLYTINGGIFKVKTKHCSEMVSQCLDAGLLQIGEPLRRSASLKTYFYMKSCYWPAVIPISCEILLQFFSSLLWSPFPFVFNMYCCHQIQNELILYFQWNGETSDILFLS